ncbi:CDP-alcohol phosphatidyltransferase family protein [Microvirga pudoricolor]|uniref:CDP-alcohol phosphatidyltransferase family protein n=1 Tax=Microvirga pudoricolor TaxID=2778729 RepID=UPI0019520DA6|nr:CDP-alcohol phosphatidyltransferase family protein [Microvirga pudoricolor]MBM6596096.1 CDP-alcohol phosphatidyltransferase family protein [Microvirga pudoricolor]
MPTLNLRPRPSIMERMTIPNLITVARLILVPIILALIVREQWIAAFGLFVVAGLSDFADGYIARRFHMESRFGAYMDPVADKLLMVSIYVALALSGAIPAWLTGLVVARDVLIVSAVLLSGALERPVEIRPLLVSKLNTAAQIAFAAFALGINAFRVELGAVETLAMLLTAALTAASAGAYLHLWLRHMTGRSGVEDAEAR